LTRSFYNEEKSNTCSFT